MPPNITADEVREAMLASGRKFFPMRECSICGTPIGFSILGGELFFSSACDCLPYSRIAPPEPREWQYAAEWVNMQDVPEHKIAVAAKLGLKLSP